MSDPKPLDSQKESTRVAARRGFLGVAAAGLVGVMLAPGIRLIEIAQAATIDKSTPGANPKVRWGMLIDTTKCLSLIHI